METNKKQYGLLIPKKTAAVTSAAVRKPPIFEESDSEEESSVDWVKRTLQKGTYGGGQSKANIDRALLEDPTVFQYDEVYDVLEKKKTDAAIAKQNDKKPKYMQRLFAAAERRKIEDERRKERQIQKEREAEGDQFADKECFVTSAYKKKLEEMKILDDAEKKNDILEKIGDVTKQPDLSGFYRHLYETISPKRENSHDDEIAEAAGNVNANRESKPARQYRKRVSTSESSSGDEVTILNKEKRMSDANSSPSSRKRASLSPENTDYGAKKLRSENSVSNVTGLSKNENDDADSSDSDKDDDSCDKIIGDVENKSGLEECDETTSSQQEVEEKPKRSIWEKRTVGEIFEATLQRYYERKASGLSIEIT